MATLQMDGTFNTATPAAVLTAALSDDEIVRRVTGGEPALFEILMRRHNRRVYRAARAVVRDEAEVEDIMQQAYMNAFVHLHQFEERAQFSTWLVRIVLNEAFARRRRRQVLTAGAMDPADAGDRGLHALSATQADPEHQAYASELRRILEHAVDALPDSYKVVFVLRDIEGMTTSEAGECLGLGEEAVKTRLHRARGMIRRSVTAEIGGAESHAFPFHAPRCDRIVAAVLRRIDRIPDVPLSRGVVSQRSTRNVVGVNFRGGS